MRRVECDLLAISGGEHPSASLLLQAGGRADYEPERAGYRVTAVPDPLHVAGSVAGDGEDGLAELSGQLAGHQAVAALRGEGSAGSAPSALQRQIAEMRRAPSVARPPAVATDGERSGKRLSTSTRTSRSRTSSTRSARATSPWSWPSATRR